MFDLMNRYYEKITRKHFLEDLNEKQNVILLLDRQNRLQGFSTILETLLEVDGHHFTALFSGDTVLEKEYWGNGALASAFGRYLIGAKLRSPFRKVYWFLISKGYRTYLLMTNNFPVHYPRFEKPTPDRFRRIMDRFYQMRYGDLYAPAKGLIHFPSSSLSCLRPAVADLGPELLKHPRIYFYADHNPEWANGVELACVAEVTLWIPLRYALKRLAKTLHLKSKSPAEKNSLSPKET